MTIAMATIALVNIMWLQVAPTAFAQVFTSIIMENFSHGTGKSGGSSTFASLFRGTSLRFVRGSSFKILEIWHLKRSRRSLEMQTKYTMHKMLPRSHLISTENQSIKGKCELH